jgi:LysM repeat protein
MGIMANSSIRTLANRARRFTGWRWVRWQAVLLVVGPIGFIGCGSLEPMVEQEVSDLQLTVDTLKTSLRDSQRTVAELRSELESRRQELADSQIARAQMDGRIREAERRLTEARHVIDLQREELSSSRTERQRVAQTGAALQNQLKQLQKQLSKIGKQTDRAGDTGAAPANHSSAKPRTSAVRPVSMDSTDHAGEMPHVAVTPPTTVQPDETIEGGDQPVAEGPSLSSLAVKPGDTLWSIAQRFHTTVQDLKVANELRDNRIHIGQALRLPSRVSSGASPLDKSE